MKLLLSSLAIVAAATVHAVEKLELKGGDHIAIVGNTLADRMQHFGWLETLIYAKLPKENLVVRNLAVAGDEVATRHRSENFGTPDEWLKHAKADVVLAFFGFNESFKGYDGLEQFRKDLTKFIKETQAKSYSGKPDETWLVLVSPIAQEKHPDPNFGDPAANNTNLRNYSDAMAAVARENGVQFIDLFTASQKLYEQAKEPLTINGIHLSEAGDRAIAAVIFSQLFGEPAPSLDAPATAKLRAAILDKNAMWHSRYRTVDGYNVYGGRSRLSFESGKGGPKITNFEVMQREMEQRDVMTANRDKRIWAVAQGGDLQVKDDNLPPALEVKTNKPGPNPDLTHPFLSGEEAIARMKVPPGCKVNLFASEEQFPELANPVQMAWDTKGRLWVASWPNYPERTPTSENGDSLLVFEDTNGDGKADKATPFIDGLNAPTGFQFYKDGVLVMQAPDLWFVRDTNGDGRADTKERVLMGLDSADSHHTTNAMCLDPGGAVYLSDGVFHRTQVETANGPVRNNDAAIYRFEPRTGRFETYIAYGFANPHGRVFDYWGNDLVTDATGNNTYFGPAFSGWIEHPAKHSTLKQFWERPSRPCPGTNILTSRHFPAEFNGNFLNCNVISFQGIFRVKVREEGSGLWGDTIPEHMVVSDDPNFRPSAVSVGPDGAVYFLDWHNPIIGHMQHHIRDPNRDHAHGRIYRITAAGRPLMKPAKIAGEPVVKLLELLKEPENDVRERAKIELGARDTQQVVAAAKKWAESLDKSDPAYEHHMMEALWLHQWHNVVDEPLLKRMLRSPEPRARAAATRVLCYWRDRVGDPLGLLRVQANDEDARVRLHAVRAASFFTGSEPIQVAYEVAKHPTDYYLDYTFNETMRTLQPKGKELPLPQDPKALAYVINRMSDKDLLRAPASEPVLMARLERKALSPIDREQALNELAKLHKTEPIIEAVSVLRQLDAKGGSSTPAADELGKLIVTAPAASLQKARPVLVELAGKAKLPSVRRAAWAGIITADADPQPIWKETAANDGARQSLVDAVQIMIDPNLRAKFQPLLAEALNNNKVSPGLRHASLRALPLTGPEHAAANYGLLANFIRDGQDRTEAARAARQLPREKWDPESAPILTESILAWAKTVPAGKRTEQAFIETVQFATELAALLPAGDATRVRKALRELGVSTIIVKSVREQMRYDVSRIVVEAGKPVEFIFENVDMMPHNFVIVAPGSREEIGQKAQTMQPQPDKQGRAYIPKDNRVLLASKLLEAGEKEKLTFSAPKQPGEYEYVCTFPGHWMIMWGKLIVTNDVDAALQAAVSAQPQAAAVHEGHQHEHAAGR